MSTLLAGYVVLVVNADGSRDLSWDGELYTDLVDARSNLAMARLQGIDVELGVVAAVPDALPVDQVVEVGVTLRLLPRSAVTLTINAPVAALEPEPDAEPPAGR